jgi:fucose 4-O-acetylase-like acetyltransferase
MNLGIEILRMVLCFWVISFHYAGVKNRLKYKILQTFFHVPTFMVISFYFNYKTLISNDIIKYKNRLERLLIPYIIWPLIFMVISKFSFNYLKIKQLIFLLLHQYITGFKIMGSLWFVGILIFLGILFQIISFLFRKRALLILQIFSIISYFIQYEEINYKIFFKYSIVLRTGSWVVDMMPIAVTGLTLRKRDIFKNLSHDKIKNIIFSIITLFFI